MTRALLFLLLTAGSLDAAAATSPESRARLHSLENLLDEEDYAGAHAAYEELRAQRPDASESLDFMGVRIAFGEGRYADAIDLL